MIRWQPRACPSGDGRSRETVRRSRGPDWIQPWTRACLIALLLTGVIQLAPGTGAVAVASLDTAVPETGIRSAEPGASPRASLDAALRAVAAEKNGNQGEAVFLWESAADADPHALAPRLALVRLTAWGRPARAAEALREALSLVAVDYVAQRWAVRHVVLGLSLGILLASLLLLAGLTGRHVQALQHHVRETLARAMPVGAAAGPLAWAAFALPFLAGLGGIAALLFLMFAASHRFGRRERMAALAVSAAYMLLGPSLWLARPLWSLAPAGTEGALIAEAQRDPTSPTARAAVKTWETHEGGSAVPDFLRGMDDLRSGHPDSAAFAFHEAARSGELPPAVLETNLGSACFLEGAPLMARQHYERATQINPGRFEPFYDLGIVLATVGDYPGADAAMERAGRAGLDRLRDIGRSERGDGPRVPVEAPLSAADLWNIDLRREWPAVPPAFLGAFFPLRSPWATVPVTILAATIGLLTGRRLRRALEVHVCFQCGRPICRRCLVRIDRHAYCHACGESMGGADLAETTRRLLRRLLEDRPAWPTHVRPAVLSLLPGTGAVLAGNASAGLAASVPASLGLVLLFFPAWGRGCLAWPLDPVIAPVIAPAGWALLGVALVVNALGVRAADRVTAGLRGFFERDVDRSAA